MSEESIYVNDFSVIAQDIMCIIEAKSTVPNIEKDSNGLAALYGPGRIIDENYLFMPTALAKELAINLIDVIPRQEKKTGIRMSTCPRSEKIFEELAEAVNDYTNGNRE